METVVAWKRLGKCWATQHKATGGENRLSADPKGKDDEAGGGETQSLSGSSKHCLALFAVQPSTGLLSLSAERTLDVGPGQARPSLGTVDQTNRPWRVGSKSQDCCAESSRPRMDSDGSGFKYFLYQQGARNKETKRQGRRGGGKRAGN